MTDKDPTKIDYDPQQFTNVKVHATDIKAQHAQRDLDFETYENAYLLKWESTTAAKMKRIKKSGTMSPDARNDVVGAVRLLISTDPVFNIVDLDNMDKLAGDMENSLTRLWEQSGRIAGLPLHHDMLTSAVLYGEMHSAVTLTSDLVANAERAARRSKGVEGEYAKAQVRKMEYLAERTPAMIENWNPRTGYSEFDSFGLLNAYYRQSTVRHTDIMRRFGVSLPHYSNQTNLVPVVLHSYWDDVFTWYWVDDTVLFADKHKLPRIPINVQISDGSRLFEKPEEQRQPILYGFIKSGMFDNQSMAYSIIYHLVFTMGSTPIVKHLQNASGKLADKIMNFDVDGGAWELEPGEQIDYMQKNIIDPSLREALNLATQKGQESTIYPQAFGAPVEGNDTYSALALLSSSGRLPLIGPQKRGGWGISKTLELALMLMKEAGQGFNRNGIEIKASSIPEHIQIETKLEVDLPQDKLQLANLATMLTKAGLASNEWVQQKFLQINDTAAMRKQSWKEQASAAYYAQRMQEMLQGMQQKAAMQAQQGQQGQPPQGYPPGTPPPPQGNGGPPQLPGQGPNPMGAGPMMANEEQGSEIQGIPPQMAGMLPGAGQAAAPPQGQRNGNPPRTRRR